MKELIAGYTTSQAARIAGAIRCQYPSLYPEDITAAIAYEQERHAKRRAKRSA